MALRPRLATGLPLQLLGVFGLERGQAIAYLDQARWVI